jgi:uncharacterized protein
MRRLIALSVLLAHSALPLPPALGDPPPMDREELAKALVGQMAAGDFEKAVEPFDKTMKQALTAAKLKQAWTAIVDQYGSLAKATATRTETVKQFDVVYVTCEFGRGKLLTKVVFTADGQITGLFFQPSGEYKPPPYVKPMAFEESEIHVGQGLFALPGTLALPKGDGPFPAVVLVHGSGPHDRDETIGPNKPFRDLAQGLASQGIAVLRYEKRTKEHPVAVALTWSRITVKEETVDDVAAAVELLAAQEKIDGQRIFVLGHSLGGSLLPRIAAASPRIAGFISFAGSTRPLEDVVLEQTRYLLSLDGKQTDEGQKAIEELERQRAEVKSPKLTVDTPAEKLPLGVPVSYWLDLRGYAPAEAAKAIKQPMLILQGERDYQVTMDDLRLWRQALESRGNVTFITYPTLNHLFMAGEGKSVPAEYFNAGNVAEEVMKDIAGWIKGIKAP